MSPVSYLMYLNLICRVIVLTLGWIIFLSSFIPVHFLLKGHDKLRRKLEVCVLTSSNFVSNCFMLRAGLFYGLNMLLIFLEVYFT